MRAAVNGTELHYDLHGGGKPLLAMHGGLGLDHSYLRPWLDSLPAQVIYYDHRGHGQSARPVDFETIGHATFSDDADALRAHLGHERIIVWGHSYGGYLALEYALRYGERLAGLILCSTGPAFDYGPVVFENAQKRGTPEQLATLQSAMGAPLDDATFRRTWMSILPLYFKHFNPEQAIAMDRATRYCGAAYSRGMTHCLPKFNVVNQLADLRTPTLILNGAEDWITPPAQAGERLAAGIPGAELVLFEDSGHFPFIEEPARFNHVVGEFLAKVEA